MKGLPCRLQLKEGRLALIDGVEKSRDDIWFYCIFDKFRIYASDFGTNFVSLVQKPVSFLLINQTIILGTLRKGIQKYVPNVKVKDIDIGYMSNDRRNHTIMIVYDSVQEDKTEIQDVTFV